MNIINTIRRAGLESGHIDQDGSHWLDESQAASESSFQIQCGVPLYRVCLVYMQSISKLGIP
jgi:hypothetical protein